MRTKRIIDPYYEGKLTSHRLQERLLDECKRHQDKSVRRQYDDDEEEKKEETADVDDFLNIEHQPTYESFSDDDEEEEDAVQPAKAKLNPPPSILRTHKSCASPSPVRFGAHLHRVAKNVSQGWKDLASKLMTGTPPNTVLLTNTPHPVLSPMNSPTSRTTGLPMTSSATSYTPRKPTRSLDDLLEETYKVIPSRSSAEREHLFGTPYRRRGNYNAMADHQV
jgi:hypothetical protein